MPDDIPTFMRGLAMLPELGLIGRELDCSKGAGDERAPGHCIGLTDEGKAMGIVPIAKLPTAR